VWTVRLIKEICRTHFNESNFNLIKIIKASVRRY